MKRFFKKEYFNLLVFIFFITTSIHLIFKIISSPSTIIIEDNTFERVKVDYVLMLAQCLLGIIAMILPTIISKRFRLDIPTNMFFLYALFLFCAIYLGEVRLFYTYVPHWDTFLHLTSGFMLGALGFSIAYYFNCENMVQFELSPVFIAAFAFCFAVTLGVFWEIYEFSGDLILKTNMQKYELGDGTPLIGANALYDTMKDLIVDIIGAFIIAVIGFISLKNHNGWLYKILIKHK